MIEYLIEDLYDPNPKVNEDERVLFDLGIIK